MSASRSPSSRRAWIEILLLTSFLVRLESPSSRRAWIEIARRCFLHSRPAVALLAEGVDRNHVPRPPGSGTDVALLAEGVDRNRLAMIVALPASSRPPRGGRG